MNVLLKSYKGDVYTTRETASSIETEYPFNFVETGDVINLPGVEVEVVKASHDAANCIGFIFYVNDMKLIHITDTGYILNENIEKFRNAHSYTIESNYEEEVLIVNDKYPFKVKQRILGERGHMSNVDCNAFLENNIGDKTSHVQFAHLSEKNNSPELVAQLNTHLPIKNKTVLQKEQLIKVNICK